VLIYRYQFSNVYR